MNEWTDYDVSLKEMIERDLNYWVLHEPTLESTVSHRRLHTGRKSVSIPGTK